MKCFECSCRGATIATVIAAALCLALPVLSKEEEFMPNQPDAIPTFLIIGTAKGGTTDLFGQLTAGPVNFDPDRPDPPFPHKSNKELAYLSRTGIDGIKMLPQKQQYMEYLELLGHPCGNAMRGSIFRECFTANATKLFTLDATPTYSFSAVVPLYLRELSGSSKVIMMIREPVERAESLFRHYVVTGTRWSDKHIDDLAIDFFKAINADKGLETALQQAANCSYGDVVCLANSWRDICGFTLMESQENKLFAAGLYNYALAVWRYHYFKPGRVLVMDSHAFFDRRMDAMEKVIRFMYGRPMLPSEQKLAEGVFHHKSTLKSPKMILSPPVRQKLSEFYEQHVIRGLFQTLMDMRDEGAWMFGFNGEPWRACPGFEEFNAAGKSKL
ncbi:hypothetical protein Vretimale_19888 [Volvox reticuliferus]|uniref:Sulfotransferase n=1 Tax=Volvox reticuliferus TaxID=1737510 RepID=A0A8J4FKM1_9CHLO|nr:hypothetical protein Vretifemale_9444 [Volvox reticuliferus]GIM17364.1 hypothetical protein Vretimale_19888 [Volvox reticuliferus]